MKISFEINYNDLRNPSNLYINKIIYIISKSVFKQALISLKVGILDKFTHRCEFMEQIELFFHGKGKAMVHETLLPNLI